MHTGQHRSDYTEPVAWRTAVGFMKTSKLKQQKLTRNRYGSRRSKLLQLISLTEALFNHDSVWVVEARDLAVLLAEPQDILEAVQRHLHNLHVHHRQQVAQRRDAVLLHQKSATPQNRSSR